MCYQHILGKLHQNKQKKKKKFQILILTYRESIWAYSPFDLFRRGILVITPLIPIWELQTRSLLIVCICGILIMIHCTLMPYRWRVNNILEGLVLFIMFMCALISAPEELKEDQKTALIVFSILPLIPIPFLIYEYSYNSLKYAKRKTKRIVRKFTMKHLTNHHANDEYDSYKLLHHHYDYQQNSDEQQQNSDNDKNQPISAKKLSKSSKSLKSLRSYLKSKQEQKSAAISATPTRSGWKYPFKLEKNIKKKIINKCIKQTNTENNNNAISLECEITFSCDIPEGTFIDSADLTLHFNDHLKILGCKVEIDRVSGQGIKFLIGFGCEWKNLDKLQNDSNDSDSSLILDPIMAMETSVINILESNDSFTMSLLKSFKFPTSDNDSYSNISIIDINIKGSINDEDKNKLLRQQILQSEKERKEKIKNELQKSKIKMKSLDEFSCDDVINVISLWILSDYQYINNREQILDKMSEEGLSGKKIISLSDKLKMVLQNILLQFMTNDTFNKMIQFLYLEIRTNKNEILKEDAPQIALKIINYPLNTLLLFS